MLHKKENETSNDIIKDKMTLPEENKKAEIGEKNILILLKELLDEATKRSRTALIILFLTTIVLGIGTFNYRGTWLFTKDFTKDYEREKSNLKEPISLYKYLDKDEALIDAINRESENSVHEYKKTLLHEIWDGSFKTVDVPPLGLELYVEDIPLLGTFGVLIVLCWFYVFRRRERGLLNVFKKKAEEAARNNNINDLDYIFYSVGFTSVFNKIKAFDTTE